MTFSDPVYMSIGYETFSYLVCSVKSNFIIKYYNKWIKITMTKSVTILLLNITPLPMVLPRLFITCHKWKIHDSPWNWKLEAISMNMLFATLVWFNAICSEIKKKQECVNENQQILNYNFTVLFFWILIDFFLCVF